ncbi:MAG: carbohydrate ABC transporter permease [Candidatus Aquiluna sp.]|nr:carbohydrate ABC transporter permease [Aquiluna sp.]
MKAQRFRSYVSGLIGIIITAVLFIVPFAFILFQAMKTPQEAAAMQFSWPTEILIWENFLEVVRYRDFMVLRAFWNSTVITVAGVTLMVVFGALIAYIIQRRPGRVSSTLNAFVLAGLITPPAVVPTIFLMQSLGLFKTIHGVVLIQVAFGLSFTIILFRGFISTIPRELDEAAIIDGAGPIRLFFQIIFPLLKSVIVTAIILQSIFVFNDFQTPLYFLPGDANVTVQLTLFNFQSQFLTKFNLLFMNILLITIPLLILFLFFNRKIVAGMTAGAVKG